LFHSFSTSDVDAGSVTSNNCLSSSQREAYVGASFKSNSSYESVHVHNKVDEEIYDDDLHSDENSLSEHVSVDDKSYRPNIMNFSGHANFTLTCLFISQPYHVVIIDLELESHSYKPKIMNFTGSIANVHQ
jgi:hypothetical protein